MFTGIIKEVGQVKSVNELDGGKEFSIACNMAAELSVDQSISINGVCHTVTDCNQQSFKVQSVEETLRKTTISALKESSPVNLERSMRPNQLLDGHIVQGHVDTAGTITDITQEGTDWLFTITHPSEFASLVVDRGSIAVDGVSLTIASIEEHSLCIAIIPYTYEHTTFKDRTAGDEVNLEFDILGKYVEKQLKDRG